MAVGKHGTLPERLGFDPGNHGPLAKARPDYPAVPAADRRRSVRGACGGIHEARHESSKLVASIEAVGKLGQIAPLASGVDAVDGPLDVAQQGVHPTQSRCLATAFTADGSGPEASQPPELSRSRPGCLSTLTCAAATKAVLLAAPRPRLPPRLSPPKSAPSRAAMPRSRWLSSRSRMACISLCFMLQAVLQLTPNPSSGPPSAELCSWHR